MATIGVTCSAPINMAVVKYWGKVDEKLIIPCNSSLSATLNQKDLKTVTSIIAGNFDQDRIWLNGVEEDINATRLQNCLREVRSRITDIKTEDGVISAETLKNYKVHIASINNFPTASGLASSASGFACLVFSLAQCFKISCPLEDLTTMARVGSGSACRSLSGGYVMWQKGSSPDGKDSVAVQLFDENHWPLNVLIVVANKEKKEISSTSGMQTTVETSLLLKHRAEVVVPERIEAFKVAIKEKNFPAFAELTMKESNQFHAVCLDTFPPIFYLNETSKKIIHLVTCFNKYHKELRAAYTFDAGPNACIFTPPEYAADLENFVKYYFPCEENSQEIPDGLKGIITVEPKGTVGYIKTSVGPGPQVLQADESLFDMATGKPKLLK